MVSPKRWIRSALWLAVVAAVLATGSAAPAAASEPLNLSGQVTDAQRSPIGSARVELRRMPSNFEWSEGILGGEIREDVQTTTVTDAEGRYTLTAPDSGVWEVWVGAPGRVPKRLRPLPVVRAMVLPPVTLAADAGARVEVRAPQGVSPKGAWVYAESADRESWAEAAADGWSPAARLGRLDASGRLTLSRAQGERLRVTVLAAGWDTGVSEVGEGDIRVTLQPRATCPRRVEVRTADSEEREAEPVSGAVVAVGRLAWPAAKTGDDGRVELRGSPGEQIQVFVLAADGRRVSGRLKIPSECTEPRQPGEVARFELAAASGFGGRVLDQASGEPLADALVWPGHDPGTFVRTDAEGRFRLPLPSYERFWVQAEAPGRVPRARWMRGEELAAGGAPSLLVERAVALDGRVVDTRESPVAGANLVIRPDPAAGDPPPFLADRAAGRAVSDAEGRFRLPALRAEGSYRLEATRSGYLDAGKAIQGIPVETAGSPGVLVRLVESAELRGRILTAEGEAIPGAGVWVAEADARGSDRERSRRKPDAVSKEEGQFVLKDLWPGEAVDVVADAEGFLAREVEGIRLPLQELLLVRLDRASSVEGRVVRKTAEDEDEEGVGVEATVHLEPAGPAPGVAGVPLPRGARELSVRTDADGRFRFAEVAPGAVVLEALADGFMPSRRLEVEVPERGSLDDLVLEVRRGAVLEGWVTDRRGEPVEKAQVRVGRVSAASEPDGHYRVEGVEPGTRTVEVEHRDFNRLTREVEIDPEWTAANFELQGGWPVAGRVIDEDGRAIASAQVEIVRWAAREHRQYRGTSGEDGGFRFPRVAEGSYTLTVTREGFAAKTEPQAFELEGRGVEDLEIVLAAGATVTGRILGLGPEELPRVRVRAENSEELELPGRIDPAGRYQITDLGPGEWRVRGSLPGGSREAVAAFAVERGQRRVERDLRFGGGLRLTGTVLFGGLPLAGARVAVTGYENATRRGVVSDAEGRFELADLPPGAYRLSVSHQRDLVVHNEDLSLDADRDVVVEIRTAAIAGRVSSATGEPIGDAMVLAHQSVGEREGSLFTVATAPDGSFRLARLTAGTFDLSIQKPGFAPWERSLRLEPGEVVEGLEAVLEPTEGLVLAVRLASGRTPPQITVSAFDPDGRLVHAEILGLTAEGHGLVSALPAGTWRLLVGAPGGAPVWVEATVPGDPVLVVLPVGGRLHVRVPALLEAGLSGSVTLADGSGQPFLSPDGAGVLRTAWPLEGGAAVIEGVPGGEWSLTVTGPQGRIWQSQVSVPAGGVAEVSLE